MKLKIKKSNIHGNGVFTQEDIKKGEKIDSYILHELIDEDKNFLRRYQYNVYDNNGFEKCYIMMGIATYINHSDNPNCKLHLKKYSDEFNEVELTSLREIKKIEEITILYFENVVF